MSTYESDLLRLLDERGHIHQVTDPGALDKLARNEVITAYVGFDPTAASLHIGNLASIMLLRRVQQAGHRPIVIMGGGTAKVGDPSGKDETRQMLTEAVFPFYIVHQSIIVLVAFWLAPLSLPGGVAFALLVAATLAGCWGFYLGGRAIGPVRPLIGLRRHASRRTHVDPRPAIV